MRKPKTVAKEKAAFFSMLFKPEDVDIAYYKILLNKVNVTNQVINILT